MENAQFAPVGSIILAAMLVLLGAGILIIAMISRRGGPERNFADADGFDRRSVIWASAEAWQASHRANAPWLVTASIGVLVCGLISFGVIMMQGPSEATGAVLTLLCVALFWVIAFCTVAAIRGRVAAKKVLAQQARDRNG